MHLVSLILLLVIPLLIDLTNWSEKELDRTFELTQNAAIKRARVLGLS